MKISKIIRINFSEIINRWRFKDGDQSNFVGFTYEVYIVS